MSLATHIKQAEKVAILLDNQFKLGPLKFGLDPIIGFIPVAGDLIPLLFSGYLIWIAIHHKLDEAIIFKMIFYALADFVVGTTPVVGDMADFFFKSHAKNLAILKQELHKRTTAEVLIPLD